MTVKRAVIIVVVVLAAIAGFCVLAHRMVSSRLAGGIIARAERLGLTADVRMGGLLSGPFCVENVVVTASDGTLVRVEGACVTDGVLSLLSDRPELVVEVRSLDIRATTEELEAYRERMKSSARPAGAGGRHGRLLAKLMNSDADIRVMSFHVKASAADNRVEFRSTDAQAQLRQGAFSGGARFSASVDFAKAPFAVRSMPEWKVEATADLGGLLRQRHRDLSSQIVETLTGEATARSLGDFIRTADSAIQPSRSDDTNSIAGLHVEMSPALELTTTYSGQSFVVALSDVRLEYMHDLFRATVGDVRLSMLEGAAMGDAVVQSVSVDISGFPRHPGIEAVRLVSPAPRLRIDSILASDRFLCHPVLGALVRFWSRDGGSILGSAPNLSVRRADVKKPRPPARKNSIPRDSILAVREMFQTAQKAIMSAPSIDIQNGRLEIQNGDDRYVFDAISFNTSELFRDDQNFQLEFNVRDAAASFSVAFDENTSFPAVAFSVRNLSSADFLKLVNMPVPQDSSGSVSCNLRFSMDEAGLGLDGDVNFDRFALYEPKISPNLIHDVNASAKLNVRYDFREDLLSIRPLSLSSGPITATGFVNITNVRSNPTIEFELGAKDVACADIPKAIPPGFLPTITELEVSGNSFSPKLTGRIPWKDPRTAQLRETGFEGRCFASRVLPHNPAKLNDPNYIFTTDYTYFVDSIDVGPGTRDYTPLSDIPPYVRAAMFLTEDKRFFDHGPLRIGFIERALRLNLNMRRYVYGGSTISQQLTKNLFLVRNKNLARKLEEAFIAWKLENTVTKSRIFELYINMIEFGPDVYGITQASRFYFNKTPSELTPLEGAYLASLKVAPSKGGRFYKSGFSTGGWWAKRMKYILKTLAENGYITPAEVIAAYPWIPRFYYPNPENSSDFRNVWLRRYGQYLADQTKARRQEEQLAREQEAEQAGAVE